MFNIPMGSLLSAMSTNNSERASLSSARGVGSMIGNIIPGMIGPVIIGMYGDKTSTGYMITGVACAAVGFVVCLLHYIFTEERRVVNDDVVVGDSKHLITQFLVDLLYLFRGIASVGDVAVGVEIGFEIAFYLWQQMFLHHKSSLSFCTKFVKGVDPISF